MGTYLFLQRLLKFIQRLVRVVSLIEQGDELRADDGTGSVSLGCLKRLLVGYSEANHSWIAKVHSVEAVEIGNLGVL